MSTDHRPIRLLLVRHAPVTGIAPGCCYGALDLAADPAATQRAAAAVAAQLAPGTPVWSSSRRRTRLLGEALRALRPDLGPMRADARLDELDFGRWEGQPWAAIDRTEFDAWMADFAHTRVGGGESVAQLLARVAVAADAVAEEVRAQPRTGAEGLAPDAVWITHAGVIRALDWLCTRPRELPQAADWPRLALDFGAAVERSWMPRFQPKSGS